MVPRQEGDIPGCQEGININLVHRLQQHMRYEQHHRTFCEKICQHMIHNMNHAIGALNYNENGALEMLRIQYLKGEISEELFRRKIQQSNKKEKKCRELREVIQFANTALANILERMIHLTLSQENLDSMYQEIKYVHSHCNQIFSEISKTYNSIVHYFNDCFVLQTESPINVGNSVSIIDQRKMNMRDCQLINDIIKNHPLITDPFKDFYELIGVPGQTMENAMETLHMKVIQVKVCRVKHDDKIYNLYHGFNASKIPFVAIINIKTKRYAFLGKYFHHNPEDVVHKYYADLMNTWYNQITANSTCYENSIWKENATKTHFENDLENQLPYNSRK